MLHREFSSGPGCDRAIMGFKSSYNHVNKSDATALSPRAIYQRLLLLLLHRNQNHSSCFLIHDYRRRCCLRSHLNSSPSMAPCSWTGSSIKSCHHQLLLHLIKYLSGSGGKIKSAESVLLGCRTFKA